MHSAKVASVLVIFALLLAESHSAPLQQIRKCCPKDQFFHVESYSCMNFDKNPNKTNLTTDLLPKLFIHGNNASNSEPIPSFQIGIPSCDISKNYAVTSMFKDINSTPEMSISEDLVLLSEHLCSNESSDCSGALPNLILKEDEICLDLSDPEQESIVLIYCNPDCLPSRPCFRKCCDPHQSILFGENDTLSCARNENLNNSSAKTTPKVTHLGLPHCKSHSHYEVDFRDSHKYKRIEILPNGNLLVEPMSEEEHSYEVEWYEYCVDDIIEDSSRMAFVCSPSNEDLDNDASKDALHDYRSTLYPTLTGISSVFLLITSITYGILWKELNLPGWLQFSYANSLLIAFSLLTIVQLFTTEIYNHSQQLCQIVGYTLHFSFLSCFFWLTSMNIDLWLSFRNTSVITGFGRSRGRRRYIGFATMSIAVPLAVTGLLVIEDMRSQAKSHGVSSSFPDEIPLITSEIGVSRCALDIHSKMAQLIYFYGVVGLLLMVNLMFFFCTVLCLRERHRETKFAHRQCTAPDSADLVRFRLFTRLFFIMGILWIFELLSWLTSYFQLSPEIQSVFVVTDALNALQGVAIFIMFVWKPQTWRQLKKKFGKLITLDSQASLVGGPNTIKSSLKSSITKSSGGSLKTATSN